MNDVKAEQLRRLRETGEAYASLEISQFGDVKTLRLVVARSQRATGGEWRAQKGAGWARFASRVEHWTQPQAGKDEEPLYAEWVEENGESSVVWRGAEQVWRVSERRVSERPVDQERFQSDEFPALAQRIVIAREPLPRTAKPRDLFEVLLYDVYWGIDERGTLARLAQRFAGFDQADIVVWPREPRRRA